MLDSGRRNPGCFRRRKRAIIDLKGEIMTTFVFNHATKTQSKLRLAIFGPSGSGKTYTSLRLGTGMAGEGGKIALIDTEFGSASKYADRFHFDVLNLLDPKVEHMIQAIQAARQYDILIIDSLTHAWKELLMQVDQLARAKYKGNSWAAWSEGTPLQNKMVHALLGFPGHIIATMRTKTEWTINLDNNGKSSPMRVGLAPEQGKGIEYEFDMLMEISPEHTINVIKDRTGRFQDRIIQNPDVAFGIEILDWLNEGELQIIEKTKEDLLAFARQYGLVGKDIAEALKKSDLEFNPLNWDLMTTVVVNYANGHSVVAN
jgi:hypothetical protein